MCDVTRRLLACHRCRRLYKVSAYITKIYRAFLKRSFLLIRLWFIFPQDWRVLTKSRCERYCQTWQTLANCFRLPSLPNRIDWDQKVVISNWRRFHTTWSQCTNWKGSLTKNFLTGPGALNHLQKTCHAVVPSLIADIPSALVAGGNVSEENQSLWKAEKKKHFNFTGQDMRSNSLFVRAEEQHTSDFRSAGVRLAASRQARVYPLLW